MFHHVLGDMAKPLALLFAGPVNMPGIEPAG